MLYPIRGRRSAPGGSCSLNFPLPVPEAAHHRLTLLLEKWHFPIPTATAILTVLYADLFTVYDIRARGELGIKDFAGRKNQAERYFSEYLPKVKAITGAELFAVRV